jgi:hypothetical protein
LDERAVAAARDAAPPVRRSLLHACRSLTDAADSLDEAARRVPPAVTEGAGIATGLVVTYGLVLALSHAAAAGWWA